MPRKTLNIIVIIMLVLSLILLVSCGDKEKEQEVSEIEKLKQEREKEKAKEEEMKQEEKKKMEKEEEPAKQYSGKKEYELQLVARKDRDRVEISHENLKRYGYNSKITTTYKNGEKFYRLRLEGLYSKAEAEDLGEELKKRFPGIKNYWIQKIQ